MANEAVVHIGENSPEQVAYKLLVHISNVEKRNMDGHGDKPADRKWVLDTYTECLQAVMGRHNKAKLGLA